MGLKIAVVGGGSTYTPELVQGFATREDRLPVDELVLFDIDAERLGVVAGLAGRMLARAGWGGRLVQTGRREQAVDGADFVVVQLRVGGQAMRLVDETLPLEFGCVGQETTGPGGFAKALRTVPVVLELAEETVRRGAPGAWFVDFTNPVGIVTQALLDRGHRAIGLCNSAIGFQRRFAGLLGVAPERVELEHVGLNHLTWERAVRVDGADRLPELLERHGPELAARPGPAAGAAPGARGRPLDLPALLLRHRRGARRAAAAAPRGPSRWPRSSGGCSSCTATPPSTPSPSCWSGAAGPSTARPRPPSSPPSTPAPATPRWSTSATTGPCPACPTTPWSRSRPASTPTAPTRCPWTRSPPSSSGLVQQAKAYERLAVEAAVTGDRTVALKALLANPLVREYRVAAPLLDALLEASRPYLPRFFAA